MLVLLLKIGAKLIAVVAKIGKAGFAAVSLVTYSYLFTWQFALLLMFSLFVHESGHVWAMKRCGMKTRGIYFIPFMGAAAIAEGDFPSRADEVYIAIMGPIWGLALAAVTGLLYEATDEPVLAAAASWMAMLNLFNLLPIHPLDGGRIMKSVAFSLHSWIGFAFLVLGLALALAGAIVLNYTLFYLLLGVGAGELLGEYLTRRRRLRVRPPRPEDDKLQNPDLTGKNIAGAIAGYATVTALLWLLMDATKHVPGADTAMAFLTDK